ncbi:MAG: formylmethanofuran--tetrahydromethanopterin N-formyltransferase [Candidatus Heimdallarchaeota archaeon]|nr:formylmethanofuran--tetrahydromethanopterin N-formyltransferase [Candidatus Heimdallarchaeota archaeon]
MTKSKIDSTFSECFEMWYSRILITAIDEEMALIAAQSTVGFATSIIMCTAEAGIEQVIQKNETPDERPGVIIQIWTRSSKKMKDELLARISQCAMTTPTTRIFNLLSEGTKSEPVGKLISYFGDGFQKKGSYYDHRTMWEIPVMDGSFLIEETFGFSKGVAGGLLILIGETEESTLEATRTTIQAIKDSKVKAITSFPGGICRAGSKVGSKYSFLNESTNHNYCPTLKDTIDNSQLPLNAQCAYEIVINAINEEELKSAMKVAINVAKEDKRILKITSTNFGGELGNIKINLDELI